MDLVYPNILLFNKESDIYPVTQISFHHSYLRSKKAGFSFRARIFHLTTLRHFLAIQDGMWEK